VHVHVGVRGLWLEFGVFVLFVLSFQDRISLYSPGRPSENSLSEDSNTYVASQDFTVYAKIKKENF